MTKKTFGHPAPQICKPILAQLVKQWGGTTRLASALGISQSRLSTLIYSDNKISESIARKIVKLTNGELSYDELVIMHIPAELKEALTPKDKKNARKAAKPKVQES